MLKRIILTGFLILKMGQINMNDLQADTSDIIKEILMCVVIAMTGMFGITGAMFTGNALYADSAGVYIYEAVITCVVVICISLPKIRKKFSIVYGLAVLLIFVATHSMIISGFVHIANQLETFFRSGRSYADIQGAVSSSDSKAYIAAQGQESLAIFLCVLIMAYIISFTVVYVRSMLVAIVEILPVMSLFIAYSVIPSAFVCVICITYVFCVAALERKKRDIKKPAVIFMICALVGTVLIVTDVVNKDYKRPQIFIDWGKDMDESVNGIFDGIVAGNADGGKNENNDDSGVKVTGLTNDGVIGEADSVQIKSDTVARITTLNTGKDLYIPTYTSYNYYYGGNKWTRALSVIEGADQKRFDMIEEALASDVLKDYIDGGTGDFERSTKIYQMTRISGDKNIPQNLTYIDIDTSYISKLVDIMQEKTDLPYGFSTHIMTDMELLNDTAHKSGGASSIQGFSLSDLNTFYTYKPKNASTQERLNFIQKLKDYFSKNYRYTLSPGRVPDGRDAVEYFLMDSREGYCTYFASSAVILLRSVNIPARYVEGYRIPADRIAVADTVNTLNTLQQNKAVITESVVDVKSSDAHAWVEAYLDGYGWITVDVTPSSQNEENVSQEQPQEQETSSDEQENTSLTDEQDTAENNQDTASAGDISTEESGNNTIAGGKVTAVFGFLWKIILIAAAILFVIIFIVRCAKKKKRVDNMLESSDVTALFNSLENLLARCGYNRFNMDYEEYAEVLEESDDIFRINNIKMIIDYVLMVNYRKNDGIDNDNNEYVCSQIRKLRESLFAKMNPLRRFVLKYIICM